MVDYTLYSLVESGNAYKPALMLQLCGADWQAKWVDFFKGEHRSKDYLALNPMGEVPLLIDHTQQDLKLSQSGVILYHLAEKFNKFNPQTDEEKRETLRWILFDNHKLTGNVSTYRVLNKFMGKGETSEADFVKARMIAALNTLNAHLSDKDWLVGKNPTIADFSMCGYLFWPDHFNVDWQDYPAIKNWLERIQSLPHYARPEDILPSS